MSKINKTSRKRGPGYHIRKIKKGVVGELSKVLEELRELQDAERQNVRIMALVELSDMYGAIYRYLERHHPHLTMNTLESLAASTEYGNLQSGNKQGDSKTIHKEIRAAMVAKGDKRVIAKLARVLGAMQLYLRHNYPGIYFTGMTLKDLAQMSKVTRRAFENGYR